MPYSRLVIEWMECDVVIHPPPTVYPKAGNGALRDQWAIKYHCQNDSPTIAFTVRDLVHWNYATLENTEALKGHRVVWKIEICYLIRMTYEWKPMSSGWHNSIVVTHPDEIPISAKSSGWHTVYDMSSGWHTAVSKSHPDEIRPGANSSGWLRVQMMLCHPDEIGEYRKSSGWHTTMPISHPDVIPPIVKSSGWDTANS